MKLSYNDKKEIRKKVEEQLRKVPEGQLIYLDKESLEFLLFETMIVNKKQNIKIKIPVWSGEFLRKIDLSQIDFTNVAWAAFNTNNDVIFANDDGTYYEELEIDYKFADEICEITDDKIKEKNQKNLHYLVDYSSTNAKIDLTKSFEALYGMLGTDIKVVYLIDCNFKGVDLSQNDLSKIKAFFVEESDISNSKLVILNEIELLGYESNLEGLNLTGRNLYISKHHAGVEDLRECNLCNTGITIEIDEDDYQFSQREIEELTEKYWKGCRVITRKKILSEMFDSISKSIDEQLGSIKK